MREGVWGDVSSSRPGARRPAAPVSAVDIRTDEQTHGNAEDFAKGYYVGILMFEVALSASASGAASKFKQIDQVQEAASQPQVAKAIDYYRTASRAPGCAVGAVSGAAAKTGVRVTRWTAQRFDGSSELARTALQRAETAGRQWQATERVRQLNASKRAALESRKAAVADYIGTRGAPAVEVLSKVDSRTARRLFDDSLCSGSSGRYNSGVSVALGQKSTFCGDELAEKLADLEDKYDFEAQELDDFADKLRTADNPVAREAYELASAEGPEGVALATDVFETDLSASSQSDAFVLLQQGGKQDIEIGPAQSRENFVNNLDDISDNKDIEDRLDSFADNDQGYKGMAGEAKIAASLQDNSGVESIELGTNIPADDVPNAPLDGSEIDIDVEGEMVINGRTMDSPAIESKHVNFKGFERDFIEIRTQDWGKKLVTWAASGEDDIVLVLPSESLKRLEDTGRIRTIRENVEDVNSDVTVEFTTYEEL